MEAERQRIAELEAALTDRNAIIRDRDGSLADRDSRICELEQEVASLRKLVEQLNATLSENSKNSGRPPSSDPPGSHKGGRGTGRKRGGQKGHKGTRRELLPPDKVNKIENHYPEQCENCWAPLPEVEDSNPTRHQITEIPPIKPHTTEHRRHEVACECCGHRTRAAFDKDTMERPFGPRLSAIVAMTTGVYHLSRRKAAALLSDVLGVRISLGGVSNVEHQVSKALEPAFEEIREAVESEPVKHTDGTGWRQSGVGMQIWTLATPLLVLFKIITDGTTSTLSRELLRKLNGILVSDRASALMFWAIDRRQICWAHLIRKFVSFAGRSGKAGRFGRDLLAYTGLIFEYWHAFKNGQISRRQLQALMVPIRKLVEELLEKAAAAGIKGLSGSCENILLHRKALWTFVDEAGVDPTNNLGERVLRDFVLWRRICQGSQSERGNRFAERIMTVAHTARKQGRDLLTFLTATIEADREKRRTPSLLGLPAG